MKFTIILLMLTFLVSCGINHTRVREDTSRLLFDKYKKKFEVHKVKRFCNEGNRCPLVYSTSCTPAGMKRPQFNAWVTYENSEESAVLKSDTYLREQKAYELEINILSAFTSEIRMLSEPLFPGSDITASLIHKNNYPLYKGKDPPQSYKELADRYNDSLKRIITVQSRDTQLDEVDMQTVLKNLVLKYKNSYYLYVKIITYSNNSKTENSSSEKDQSKTITFQLRKERLEDPQKTIKEIKEFLRKDKSHTLFFK